MKKKLSYLIYALAVFSVTTGILQRDVTTIEANSKEVITEGVSISGIQIGGETIEKAKALLWGREEELLSKNLEVEVTDAGKVVGKKEVSFRTLQTRIDIEKTLETVTGLTDVKNLVQMYKNSKDVKEGKKSYSLALLYNKTAFFNLLEELERIYGREAVDAKLVRENKEIKLSGGEEGKRIDRKEAEKKLEELLSFSKDISSSEWKLSLPFESIKPAYAKESMKEVKELLGSYTTEYSTEEVGWKQNLENAVKHLEGTVVLAGEVFSLGSKLQPFDETNGYVGHDKVGGPMNQVATTLYNAILFSELEIVEKQSIAEEVSYIPLGRDASVLGNLKDFRFKNTSESPIYIGGSFEDGKLTFEIYGKETREKGRKLEFKTEKKEVKKVKDKLIKDADKEEGYREVLTKGREGSKVELHKIVKLDGKEVDYVLVDVVEYEAIPNSILVGTGKAGGSGSSGNTAGSITQGSQVQGSPVVRQNTGYQRQSSVGNSKPNNQGGRGNQKAKPKKKIQKKGNGKKINTIGPGSF